MRSTNVVDLILISSGLGLAAATAAAEKSVSLYKCVNCNSAEAKNYNSYESVTNVSESLLPFLVAHTDSLECTPETVAEVKTESYEPYDVENYNPPILECCVKKIVRFGSVVAHELLKLHLSPEVVEMECDETKNNDSEKKHVL